MEFPLGDDISVIAGPKCIIYDKPMLLHRFLDERVGQNWAATRRLPALVTKQLDRLPADAETITYEQLLDMSVRAARRLRIRIGKARGENDDSPLVGVCANKTPKLMAAVLSVLRAGAAFVPLDGQWPAQRLHHIFDDAKPSVVICGCDADCRLRTAAASAGLVTIGVDELFSTLSHDGSAETDELIDPDASATALVLYTSGTTGNPKGARLPHRGLMNALRFRLRCFRYHPDEEGLLKTVLTFSDATLETFETWFNLRPLIVLTREQVADSALLLRVFERCRIYRTIVVPSLLAAMLELIEKRRRAFGGCLSMLSCDGEALDVALAERFYAAFPKTRLANFYGSTEVCADATYIIFDSPNEFAELTTSKNVPIGRVVDNLIVYLLDDDLRPVRRGERGEIFMTGPSVCNSYIGGGQGKFFASPFVDRLGSEHAVMHRVGDLASLDNGLLYAHGRRDRVIKVRGHKVNLDAYTITLREESAAFGGSGGASRPSESIVFADRHFVETKILAFVYYAGVEHKVAQKRADILEGRFRALVPALVVPRVVASAAPLPRTEAGKIDRAALLKAYRRDYENLSENDQSLLGLLASAIGVTQSRLDPQRSFMENGGTSLNVVGALAALRDAGGYQLSIDELMRASSIHELERLCEKRRRDGIVAAALGGGGADADHSVLAGVDVVDLRYVDKAAAIRVAADGLGGAGEIGMDADLKPADVEVFMAEAHESLVADGMSFALVRRSDERVLAVSYAMDFCTEPAAQPNESWPLALCDILELVGVLEEVESKFLPKERGRVWHAFIDAIDLAQSEPDRVGLMCELFRLEALRARRAGYECIVAESVNALTQDLARHVADHKTYYSLRMKDFETTTGRHPYGGYPDDYSLTIDVLWLRDTAIRRAAEQFLAEQQG